MEDVREFFFFEIVLIFDLNMVINFFLKIFCFLLNLKVFGINIYNGSSFI